MNYVKYLRDKIGHDVINLTGVNVLIINGNNQVLLQRRGTYPFKWGLIGGITELGVGDFIINRCGIWCDRGKNKVCY